MSFGGIFVSILIVGILTISRAGDENAGFFVFLGGIVIAGLLALVVWKLIRAHTSSTGRAVLLTVLCIIFPPLFFVLLLLWALGFDRQSRHGRNSSEAITQSPAMASGDKSQMSPVERLCFEWPFKEINGVTVSSAPEIGSDQLRNAVSSFANEARVALVLLDTTMSKNGKEGLLISKEGIFVKEMMEKPKSMLFEQIKAFEINNSPSFPGASITLRINSKKFFELEVGNDEEAASLEKFFDQLGKLRV